MASKREDSRSPLEKRGGANPPSHRRSEPVRQTLHRRGDGAPVGQKHEHDYKSGGQHGR
jgi:hypothetical protein